MEGQVKEQTEIFEYPGIEIKNHLSSQHADKVHKRPQQHIFILGMLKGSHVRQNILTVACQSLIKSVLTFNIACWYNFFTEKRKKKNHNNHQACNQIHQYNTLPLLQPHSKKKSRLYYQGLFTAPFSCFYQEATSHSTSSQKENLQKLFHSNCNIHFKQNKISCYFSYFCMFVF